MYNTLNNKYITTFENNLYNLKKRLQPNNYDFLMYLKYFSYYHHSKKTRIKH